MPNFTGKYLEDFVDYLDNETQTDDLSDSEDEIKPFAIKRELLIQKKTTVIISAYYPIIFLFIFLNI